MIPAEVHISQNYCFRLSLTCEVIIEFGTMGVDDTPTGSTWNRGLAPVDADQCYN